MNLLKQKDREELDAKLPSMPWYIEQFIAYKLPDLSPSSLLEYVRDYETFMKWLMAEGLTEASSYREVKLTELEVLKMESIDNYRMFLSTHKPERNNRTTISRKLSSLRSLFHYLSQIAEDDDFYPLLKRNVMAKVTIKRTHKPKDTAAKLEGKLLQEEEIAEFMAYVKVHYGTDVADNKQASHSFQLNSVRDACIISFILHSGLRVSEVVNLNVDDIDLKKKLCYVFRKGKNDDTFKTPVYFRQEAVEDLTAYIAIRETRYKSPRKEKALFLAIANGKNEGSRMTKRAIQAMVIKYAKRFGKPYLSVHKLRHSFATDYYLQNDIYKTQEQLGHASPETTQIYAHLTDKTMAEAIDRRQKEGKPD
ncbi:tyrosine recombinase XerS [Paenibacillus sp. MY03]|jgi:site-specific recombinase XerD|uniref:Tyrosine recombinase XerS n=1 Tax=Paenibacillus agaridevorans TaxID=171404 RepID=A0A2R5EQH8_9BACL|nr:MULTISPECIES: tyrosine recombinase XerS [Paenibacillus]OUS75307.1 tyrosine recombinase XerS [Paenibacillus sp. MY03]QNK55193.1 tyrosine recombinase XerS [Paenibacillus sp. PAMC21692]GBG07919.1 tyrosine recombinase XerS [Paenibacillus agaridevorans]